MQENEAICRVTQWEKSKGTGSGLSYGSWEYGRRGPRIENPATDERRGLRELVTNALCMNCPGNRVRVQRLDIESELRVGSCVG